MAGDDDDCIIIQPCAFPALFAYLYGGGEAMAGSTSSVWHISIWPIR
jgi:hypothetical protein